MSNCSVRHPWCRRRRKGRNGSENSSAVQQVMWRQKDSSQQCGIERLPILVHENGRALQCTWDGRHLGKVDFCDHLFGENGIYSPAVWLNESFARFGRTLHNLFVPEQVRPQYIHYMNWKALHRVFSSILQVQCTQAMLRAIGIGAKRALPSAAALNWVLKDGLGRLGKLTYNAHFGSSFDSDLKRVRFSTSVLFSLSLGLEMLTPLYPHHFLLMATLANVGKSISYAAYLATSSAIHRSFALADNLSDISAKGQVQTVVCDNLGLAIAVGLNHYYKSNTRMEKILPLASFPILAAADLFAIYHELRAVHLRTLNKERLELVVNTWLRKGVVPSVEEISNVETSFLLQPSKNDSRHTPLRIGVPNLRRWKADDLLAMVQSQGTQRYLLCQDDHVRWIGRSQRGLSMWLHETASSKDVITGVLQACYLRSSAPMVSKSAADNVMGLQANWQDLFEMSRRHAEGNVDALIAQIEDQGWQIKRIVLSPQETATFSILNS